jgi:hypothetical protein
MKKRVMLLVILIFLTASCISTAESATLPSINQMDNVGTTKASMQQARFGLGVAVVNGKIYAVGGRITQNFVFVGTNEEYDPATDAWTPKTPMPTSRANFGIAVYKDKIYCIGGLVDYREDTHEPVLSGANEVYDPAADSWETLASMPTPREGVTASCVGDRIYLIGGDSNLNEVYDPATDSWTTVTPIPATPDLDRGWSCSSVVVDGKIHVIGAFPFSNSHQIYDPSADMWSMGPQVIAGYYFAGAGATSGASAPSRIYVFGADRCFWPLEDYPQATAQSYDPLTGNWTVCASMPSGRLDVAVAVVNDVIYAIGGFTPVIGNGVISSALNEQYVPIGHGTVPEFPSWIILPLLIIGALNALVYFKKRRHRKPHHIFLFWGLN